MASLWTYFVFITIFGISSCTFAQHQNGNSEAQPRVRRKSYVCPPGFNLISNNCYYFSTKMATWHEAHHDCRERHSQLAVISTATEDQKLRNQLNGPTVTPLDWWIGGIYDWEQIQWTWGVSGKKLDYRGFSRMNPNDKDHLKWHCIIMDPRMKYKWSARSCVIGKHYICQTKVSRVGPRGLEKLRRKYKVNENNQLNEIPVPLSIYDRPNSRKHQETHGLKHHKPSNLQLQTNEINSFAYKNNTAIARRMGRKKNRKSRKGKGRKNRNRNRNRNRNLQQRINGTQLHDYDQQRDHRRRNRRNKSKEQNSGENVVLLQDETRNRRLKNEVLKQHTSSMEDITQKTTYLFNTISPLHPRVIIEEHDFKD